MRDGGYPAGAREDRNAPYNQPDIQPEDVEVDIIVTMSLTTKIKVDDYDIEQEWDDDEGKILVKNFENCNLIKQAQEQIPLPMDPKHDWFVDDYQVFLT